MNPSHDDSTYQARLGDRGAYLEYDMIGMPYLYPGEGQSPSDDEAARAIARLVDAGFGDRIVLSSDVFLKMMLSAFGGMGYAHVLERFVPRLRRHGVGEDDIERMLADNPRALFETASNGGTT
jgi:phosphotriesterase-related protein